MNDETYNQIARLASRLDPAHDADRLHDAFVETRSEHPAVLIVRTKQRVIDERRRLIRLSADYLSKRRQIPHSDGTDPAADPVHQAHLNELRESVQIVIRSLPSSQQLLVRLLWWEGLTPKEIAKRLVRPRATIYAQLRNLRQHLFYENRLNSCVKTD